MCNTKSKALAPICMALSILAIVATVQAHENHVSKPQQVTTPTQSAIRKSVDEGAMPPFRYRILHRNSALSEDEKAKVTAWIDASITSLDQLKKR